jgi:hypothetical protein
MAVVSEDAESADERPGKTDSTAKKQPATAALKPVYLTKFPKKRARNQITICFTFHSAYKQNLTSFTRPLK